MTGVLFGKLDGVAGIERHSVGAVLQEARPGNDQIDAARGIAQREIAAAVGGEAVEIERAHTTAAAAVEEDHH